MSVLRGGTVSVVRDGLGVCRDWWNSVSCEGWTGVGWTRGWWYETCPCVRGEVWTGVPAEVFIAVCSKLHGTDMFSRDDCQAQGAWLYLTP